MAATLHDVGKIAVPEAILSKPGPLTDEEYTILKRHPVVGAEICSPLRAALDILPAVLHHHERWDGRGYPHGLTGEAIPTDARIIAIIDAFDAMTSDRPYRPGLSIATATAIIRENKGPQWDPAILDLFLNMIEQDLSPSTAF
jgi:putative two-component system response regulator